MAQTIAKVRAPERELKKAATGIQGLDEITGGGLPRGRPTLICGGAGCGKTLLAMEFLIRGILRYDEPGVFMAFEESADDLTQNVRSLGFDLDVLVARKKLVVDFVRIERSEIEEAGAYDLDGLFVRLAHAIETVRAKRVVLDTLETLFGGLSDHGALRAELRRLFRWLKDKGVTAVITGERGDGALTRHGLEEYVSDCVILLDHRVIDQVSTRRLRIVKYRGTAHGTNEFPFLIDEDGISVMPLTSLSLRHKASDERVSSGVPKLDVMLGGKGYFRGSTVLLSGPAGGGKTSLACHFAKAACGRGERCLYLAFEESSDQIVRNMRSIGLDLQPWINRDVLRFHAVRSTLHGLEMHLASIHKLVSDYKPRVVVIDPIGSLVHAGSSADAASMVLRLVDFLKARGITALMTSVTASGDSSEVVDIEIASLVDTWLLLRNLESGGERNRGIYVLKSRGMAHSNQIREFLLTDRGIELADVHLGPGGVLTGSMRVAHQARETAAAVAHGREIEDKRDELERRRAAMEAQVAELRRDFGVQDDELRRLVAQSEGRESSRRKVLERMVLDRQAPPAAARGRKPAARPGK